MTSCVRVYQPTKNAMQSGRVKTGTWVVEFVNPDVSYQEPLMGWQATQASFATKRLTFASRDEALAYVQAKNFSYTLEEAKQERTPPKQYGHHFRPGKVI